ncbi:MAG TPA: Ig-like domain-containing protein [Ferruginibacter sp.]|nr:Ig-like domain-containing protein [Ferruginibacter sp.]
MKKIWIIVYVLTVFISCKKKSTPGSDAGPFNTTSLTINNKTAGEQFNIDLNPTIIATFSDAVDRNTVAANVSLLQNGTTIPVNYTYLNNDSAIQLQPVSALKALTGYEVNLSTNLLSIKNIKLSSISKITFVTQIDSTNKFPLLSDSALLTLVEQQTFKYFWDFGDPVSGLARERNSDVTTATTGGTGFGIMATIVAVNRNFITHAAGLNRISIIVNFYKNNVTAYHGAFPHWINGSTGATIPFSTQDNGGDIVETSYLMEGLLCARQY